jgi:hypothetical protein
VQRRRVTGPYSDPRFRRGTFENFELRLAHGDELTGADLALALEGNPDVPLPPAIREYVIRWLRGEVKARRGRKPLGWSRREMRDVLAPMLYERYFTWLKRRKKRLGLEGWPLLRRAEWWQGPPSERAARMVARHLRPLFANQDWRHVLNEISAQRHRGRSRS